MSNDAPSSSAAPIRDSGDAIPSTNESPATGGQRLRDGRRQKKKTKKRKKRNEGLRKKLDFVTDLLKGLDTFVFAELSALYYMEYVEPNISSKLVLIIDADAPSSDF
ncbi:DUF1746-domain protein [Emericellopsis cladophorae]|uniref:DUF1746-domain protein n=1 Tax=Emericellopsis cladophorae TaxID=2686198 RepID=A0A9P9XYD7_9HYPO|nr:DUF1746-domain protein [Emericellopsis cladophorae]KAI6780191.1 DUF1746-domain protein [Emericellopsis cladophorae]